MTTGGSCGSTLVQNDLVLGAAPSYSIKATELNSLGYSYSICYSCDIIPIG